MTRPDWFRPWPWQWRDAIDPRRPWRIARPRWAWWWRRLRLFARIVWRTWEPGYRLSWSIAWRVAQDIYGEETAP